MTRFEWERKLYPALGSTGFELYSRPDESKTRRHVGLEVVIPSQRKERRAETGKPKPDFTIDARFNHPGLGTLNAVLQVKNGKVINVIPSAELRKGLHSRWLYLPIISKMLVSHVVMSRLRKALQDASNPEVEKALNLKKEAKKEEESEDEFPRGEQIIPNNWISSRVMVPSERQQRDDVTVYGYEYKKPHLQIEAINPPDTNNFLVKGYYDLRFFGFPVWQAELSLSKDCDGREFIINKNRNSNWLARLLVKRAVLKAASEHHKIEWKDKISSFIKSFT